MRCSHKLIRAQRFTGRKSTLLTLADSSVTNASTSVLEPLLEAEGCDVDLQNRLEGDTPLHIAVRNRWEDQDGLQLFLGEWYESAKLMAVESLLEAGADPNVRNKRGLTPQDLLPASNANADSPEEQVRQALRRAQAELAVGAAGDVVNDDDDDIIDPNDVASDSD